MGQFLGGGARDALITSCKIIFITRVSRCSSLVEMGGEGEGSRGKGSIGEGSRGKGSIGEGSRGEEWEGEGL